MSYLGRNVNLALLVIIIGVVIVLVGTTVFFQRGLQNRTSEYQQTNDDLSQCRIALNNYMSQANEAQENATRAFQDIRKYDELYEQKSGELKSTKDQLSDSQKQTAFERLQKEKFQQFYEAEKKTNYQLNQTINYQQNEIDSLNDDLADLCRECKSTGGDCRC